ncbi:MAG: phosphopantothenoylcysteine decarboxylase [Phycisphaerales bacterium JB039]
MPARILITAGPTYEPIDAVRFLGNRSSGRLGLELARTAADRGMDVTLLLGPSPLAHTAADDSRLRLARFLTTDDLASLLESHQPGADILVLAAAVADFRPAAPAPGRQLRRAEAGLTLELEPTPDLSAQCVARRRPGQLIIAFALEPRESMLGAALMKLRTKGVDLIVANPLETMDAETIEATLLAPPGPIASTPGAISKGAFAAWLLDHLPGDRA